MTDITVELAALDPAREWAAWEPSASDNWDLRKAGHLLRRAAFAGNWELFGPSDARFVALGGTPKFDGLVFGYTIATTGGGKALQPYVSLDNGQRWRRTPPIDVDPSTRT